MHTIEAFSIYSNIPEAGAVNDQKHQEKRVEWAQANSNNTFNRCHVHRQANDHAGESWHVMPQERQRSSVFFMPVQGQTSATCMYAIDCMSAIFLLCTVFIIM